jgi:hemolysin activation/secretion protein
MQQIANAVTEYYRSAGYVLAQAFIPAQEVENGQVQIAVLEGTLGNVLVEGNEKYSSDVLASPFEELIDAPVTADGIESAILTASDFPGLSVFGVFRPGRTVGTTDLVLRVQDERSWDASVRLDNHGTRFTGLNRVIVEGSLNNPTGAGDRLSGTALRQVNPGNSNFGEIRYERPFWVPGLLLGGSYSRNPFKVGAELKPVGLTGESTTVELYADRSLARSRAANTFGRVGWRRTVEVTSVSKQEVGKDHLSYLFGELRFDGIDAEAKAINAGTLGFAYGLGDKLGGHGESTASAQSVPPRRQGGSTRFSSNDFWKLQGTFSRFQKITEHLSMLARLEGQWSHDLLTSEQQYSIGGPTNVRAYNVSEFLVDKALYASMEWTLDAPFFADAQFREGLSWGQVLKVSFFADFAWGQINDPLPAEDWNLNLGGIGAGLSFNLPGRFLTRLQYARPVGKLVPGVGTPGFPSDGESHQWWLDLTYQF